MALEAPPPEALPAPAAPHPGLLISLALLIVSVSFATAGQFTLKSAMDNIGRIGGAQISSAGQTVTRMVREPRLWIGLTLFGISALFWLVVLSRVDLSLAYPFVGISYVVVVFVSKFALHEPVPPLRWVGVAVVAIGIAIVGLSFKSNTG